MKIGVIGLGSMGYGIASVAASLTVMRYTGRTSIPARSTRLRAEGGAARTSLSAAPGLDAVLVVVLNAAQAEAVLFGDEGIVARLAPAQRRDAVASPSRPSTRASIAERCATHGVYCSSTPPFREAASGRRTANCR